MSTTDAASPAPLLTPPHAAGARANQPQRTVWTAITGAIGVAMGLAPHVLHHVGPLVGTALVAGAGGTALFGVLGLAASVPMLLRLRRRFASWWAPAIALAIFATMFGISTFVVGPLISGATTSDQPAITQTDEHAVHH